MTKRSPEFGQPSPGRRMLKGAVRTRIGEAEPPMPILQLGLPPSPTSAFTQLAQPKNGILGNLLSRIASQRERDRQALARRVANTPTRPS